MSIPLLVGIIGHREIPVEYQAELTAELSQALDDIRLLVPNTPIVLASSLAEGADRLGAYIGLSKGIKLIAPLPFDAESFRGDFPHSVDEFNDLLSKAQRSFVVSDGEFEGYEGASRWIARHCQIVIALWGGNEGSCRLGGTAHTILLRSEPGRAGHSLSSAADCLGPVLHIHCPRAAEAGRNKPKWIWPQVTGERLASLKLLLSPLERFNESASDINKRKHLHSDLDTAFVAADTLSSAYQKRFQLELRVSLALAVLGYTFMQLWEAAYGKLFSFTFLLLAFIVVYRANRIKSSDYYLEYRALAEVLRIARFRRLAGVPSSPTERFLDQHWGSLRWIRSAVNTLWVLEVPTTSSVESVKSEWIDDQETYYKKQSTRGERLKQKARWATGVLFIMGMALVLLGVVKPGWGDLASAWSGVFLMLVGVLSHYAHTQGWKEDASRYRSMTEPFSSCKVIWQFVDEDKKRGLIEELGGECVAELSDWLLTRKSKAISFIKE